MSKITLKTILISGPDAATFLQGFITCNVADLNNAPLFAAACNQKGRMIANFWIWRECALPVGNPSALSREQALEIFYLQLPESMTDTLTEHLKKYQFRSKVHFETTNKAAPSEPQFDPVWIVPKTTEQFTPQMIDLQKHGGVSFKKGCYLGQEIITRTEHLGKLKRHLHTLTIKNKMDVSVGDDITSKEGQKIGTVVAINKNTISAVIEDRAMGSPLYLGSITINAKERHDR